MTSLSALLSRSWQNGTDATSSRHNLFNFRRVLHSRLNANYLFATSVTYLYQLQVSTSFYSTTVIDVCRYQL
ncbi:unnamed protein product [Brassica oleracea]